ncbi:Protein CBG16162 [Caenorhabditis briggsae]|uniref:Protein CBG16162 n=1 Tax=Caenorhabditis briggsae TaxID=6238 RepID=A8XNZ6_CAEBR|nr:Protein CBG16162 [Caenorhabditis briggsae]CAP34236.1 Protein CBG16162 [Caenorhabditis briggsae]
MKKNRQDEETSETSEAFINGSPTLDSLIKDPNADATWTKLKLDATFSTVTTFNIVRMDGCSFLSPQAMEPSSGGHRKYANPNCRRPEDSNSEP